MSKKIVIVSGGELEESFVLSELETLDSQFIIGVDKGMEFLYGRLESVFLIPVHVRFELVRVGVMKTR